MDEAPAVPRFWLNWLRTGVGVLVLFGLVLIISPGLAHAFFNWAGLGSTQMPIVFPDKAIRQLSFVYGTIGTLIIGWMILTLTIIEGPFAKGERAGWTALAAAFTIWFTIGLLHASSSGYWAFALIQAAVYGGFIIPLYATFNLFQDKAP